MSQTIKLKKGFDINIVGKPAKNIGDVDHPETFAVKPTDFVAITRPKLLVNEGDNVKAGTPLFYDKYSESVMYAAPVSGEVVEIKRGEKRKLLEVKILADKEISFEQHKKYSVSDIAALSKEEVVDIIAKGGAWPQIVQRPYGIVADPTTSPKSIFISAFDSSPLAPDVAFTLSGKEQDFQAGLDVLKKMTSGTVHVTTNGADEIAQIFAQASGVQINKVIGPHPAGNVGTQIHHIDPINKGDIVWTVSPFGVAQIGKLFLEGILDTARMIAVTGSEVATPEYVKTYTGACLNKIAEKYVSNSHVRYISGNVLTGENIGKDGYLGYYQQQVTVIPEGDQEEFFGWVLPSRSKLSYHRAFGLFSFLNPKKERIVDTNTHGEHRQFVISGAFEDVVPMDILPTYLFKSIISNDYDEMEALGIYEVVEEDVALCEFIDVSKNEVQGLVREGIEMIRNS
ncbi:MAG: Na+-transporting NADH:ubiquinone oxidoreductase subunit A [Paraglaciecola sp.]|jgi:Na+-transporting NADH:ubiquinone oxidoreductase subunit A